MAANGGGQFVPPMDWTDLVDKTRVLIATCDTYDADHEPAAVLADALHDCLSLLGQIVDYAELLRQGR